MHRIRLHETMTHKKFLQSQLDSQTYVATKAARLFDVCGWKVAFGAVTTTLGEPRNTISHVCPSTAVSAWVWKVMSMSAQSRNVY